MAEVRYPAHEVHPVHTQEFQNGINNTDIQMQTLQYNTYQNYCGYKIRSIGNGLHELFKPVISYNM